MKIGQKQKKLWEYRLSSDSRRQIYQIFELPLQSEAVKADLKLSNAPAEETQWAFFISLRMWERCGKLLKAKPS